MCELNVYAVSDGKREKVMEGVIRLTPKDGKVKLEGIFGEALEVFGSLGVVDILAQEASIIVG